MNCNICKLPNRDLLNKVEFLLDANSGTISAQNKKDLIDQFPAYKKEIEEISDQDANIHWNFHQTIARAAKACDHLEKEDSEKEKPPVSSLTNDIGKDEATALYELLNGQAATFNVLSKKVNRALEEASAEDMTGMLIHPNTSIFYKELSDSIRATVREIVNFNVTVNGSKNGALEGLKALAAAIGGSKEQPIEDKSTKEYD